MVQQIGDNQTLTLTLMSWFGESVISWPINAELGDLSNAWPRKEPMFRFLRYDIKLELDWLKSHFGVALSDAQLAQLRRFDDPDAMDLLESLATKAAEEQVKAEDWTDIGGAGASGQEKP
jgi:uncharacterized protein